MSDNAAPKRLVFVAIPVVVLSATVGGVAYFMLSGNQADEKAAGQAITELGGITVLDANGEHIATLNLQLVKDEAAIKKAMALVADLPHLQVLDASTTSVGDDDLAAVGALRNLNSLHLNDTQVTDDGLIYLAPLRQLHGLHVARTKVTDEGLTHIAKLPGLVHLDLSGDNVGPGLAQLTTLPKLRWLLVEGVPLEPPVIEALGKLTQIERVSIGDTDSRPELVQELKKKSPGLEVD